MTTVGVIGDIHGNAPAMDAAFDYIDSRGVKDIYCLGDMFGKGPSTVAVYDAVFARCAGVVAGNWDLGIVNETYDITAAYYRGALGPERCARIAQLPRVLHLTLGGKRVKLYHGRPELPRVIYSDSPREQRLMALNAFQDGASDVTGFADIHAPFVQMLDARILFNCGSVGNACDGLANASLALLHWDESSDALSVEIARVPYDIARARRDAANTPDLPYRDEYLEELRTARYARRG